MKRNLFWSFMPFLVPALILSHLLAGCKANEDAHGPAPIAFGEESCSSCRMIISEERYAAQVRFYNPPGVEKFDDIGCLVAQFFKNEKNKDGENAALSEVWVTDHSSGAWIDGRKAFFVRAKKLATPMASGLAAFASAADAKAFADRVQGDLLSFQDLATIQPAR